MERTPDSALSPLEDDRPNRPADDKETVYYEGSPLIRGELGKVFLWTFLAAALIAAPFIYYFVQGDWWPWWVIAVLIVLGIVFAIIPYLLAKQIRYRITNYRIDFERGLISKTIDTMELWHVDDIKFHQSFLGRMFGVGTISILSDDKTTPKLDLRGLPSPRPVFDALKTRIIGIKRQRGVIKMDVS